MIKIKLNIKQFIVEDCCSNNLYFTLTIVAGLETLLTNACSFSSLVISYSLCISSFVLTLEAFAIREKLLLSKTTVKPDGSSLGTLKIYKQFKDAAQFKKGL